MSKGNGPIGAAEIYAELVRIFEAGEDAVLATVIQTRLSTPRQSGSKMIIYPDGRVCGSVGGGRAENRVIEEAAAVFTNGNCRRVELDLKKGLGVCGGWMEVFLEPVSRARSLVIIGAGHVGLALVELARSLPVRLTVIDDRPEFLDGLPDHAGLRRIAVDPAGLGQVLNVQTLSGVVLASRTHELDTAYLEAILQAEVAAGREIPFLGALGSRTKSARVRRNLVQALPDLAERLERVQMPVGLAIGAETPGEIALSIMAEAWAVWQGAGLLTDDQGRAQGVRLHRFREEPAGGGED